MSERLTITEILELFNELNSELCPKDDFIEAKRVWSSETGRKLANSGNAKHRDQFKKISQHIRIMDYAYDENIELIYKSFLDIAKKILPEEKKRDKKHHQVLFIKVRNELKLGDKLAREFIISYIKNA